jgi:transcriptional regulator with XRE-family HTH domain
MATPVCYLWTMSQIGDTAKQLRESHGWTQEYVARRADLPLSTYQRVELGYNQPTLDTLRAIADGLDTTVGYLLGEVPAA